MRLQRRLEKAAGDGIVLDTIEKLEGDQAASTGWEASRQAESPVPQGFHPGHTIRWPIIWLFV